MIRSYLKLSSSYTTSPLVNLFTKKLSPFSFILPSDFNRISRSLYRMSESKVIDPTPTDRPLLMIPGPVEYESAVLSMLGTQTLSHISPIFIQEFSNVLKNLKVILNANKSQPLVISSSGTTGWDCILANLCEDKDNLLVLNTGYFS